MIPNLEYVVHQVRLSKPYDFSTKEGLCEYSDDVVLALHAVDKNFGHLVKVAAQNHCTDRQGRMHAVDCALYRPTGQVVDFIRSAGFGIPAPPNEVTWHVGPEGEYGPDRWYAPGNSEPEDLTPRVKALEEELVRMKRNFEQAMRYFDEKVAAKADHARVEAINERLVRVDDSTHKKGEMPVYSGRLPYLGWEVRSKAIE